MNKNVLNISIVVAGVLISGTIVGSAGAQTGTVAVSEISYPVAELNNCANKGACKTYCNNPTNVDACLSFAEKNNLMTKEEIKVAKNFKNTDMTGPGECKGKDKCDKYCSNSDHVDECVTFAEKNGLMSDKQLGDAKKVKAAIARGVKQPACSGPSCDAYCAETEHMEECINFSIEAGIMDPQKQDESKKVLSAIKRGIKPPACKGRKECDAYCGSTDHMEECMNFAVEVGMMSKQEVERAQKSLDAIKQGIMPPACKGEECKTYCAEESHVEECVKFGEATGMIKKEDVEMIRKTGGKGPGGCVGKDACGAFCNNPDNADTCFNFGKENGLISAEDVKKMEEGKAYCASNPDECKDFNGGMGFGPGNGEGPGNGNGPGQGNGNGFGPKNGEDFGRPGNGEGFGPGNGGPGPGNWKGPKDGNGPGNGEGFGPDMKGGPNEGQGFNPGSGQNGNGPGMWQGPNNGDGNGPGPYIKGGPGNENGSSVYIKDDSGNWKGPNSEGGPGQSVKVVPVTKIEGGPNEGQGFNPGSGQNGNGPGNGNGPWNGKNGSGPGMWQGPNNGGGPGPNVKVVPVSKIEGGSGNENGPGPGIWKGPDMKGGPNEGQGFNPGSGQNGNGPKIWVGPENGNGFGNGGGPGPKIEGGPGNSNGPGPKIDGGPNNGGGPGPAGNGGGPGPGNNGGGEKH